MRIWTLDEIFRRWPNLWFRIVFETALPTLGAAIWGTKAFIASKDLFVAATAGGLAFTAVLFVQGQILRMAKNVRDERDADEFRQSFASIREILERLQKQVPQELEREVQQMGGASDNPLIIQAHKALEAGLYDAASLAGAAAFEKALRQLAAQLGLDTRRSAGALLRSLFSDWLIRGDLYGFFQEIVTLRNSLVHPATDKHPITKADAERAIAGFNVAIRYIEEWIFQTEGYTKAQTL